MNHKLNFEFSPSLITLLGEQLIHDKKIALSELVKNAYDADANIVEINITNNEIIITDDGCGMNIDTIKNIWLKPGVSHKKENIQNNIATPKYGRMPIGEKGVGRLGCHRLGNVIELFSKEENEEEVYFSINWKIIEKSQSINNLPPIEVTENNIPIIFKKNQTGTKIIIKELKETWEENDIKKVSQDLYGFISPFIAKDDFNIVLKRNNELFGDDFSKKIDFIKENALYYFKVVFSSKKIIDFSYQFTPWKILDKLQPKQITLHNNLEQLKKLFTDKLDKNLEFKNDSSDYQIGDILFEGFIHDFDNLLLNKQFNPDEKKLIKTYMKNSSGVRVYRDGLRVFNYGEHGNDILELDLKRVNNPGSKISSNQLLGAISLDRKTSLGLIEKTNREGFIHNKNYLRLQECLDKVISVINTLRESDKVKIKDIYLTNPEDKASIENRIKDIQTIIDQSNLDDKEKTKINSDLKSFSREFEQIKNVFLQASTTGLNLTFVIHELDKVIDFLEEKIETKDLSNISVAFGYLKKTIANYKDTIRLDKKRTSHSITNIVEQAIFNFDLRFRNHKIEIVKDIADNIEIKGRKNLVIGAVNNIFDNSIYWLKTYGVSNRKILIKSYKNNKYINLVIADNGKGFNIDFNSALHPFITGRSDESSMGIGLHLVKVILGAHQGFLIQGNYTDEMLPEEFKDGAIIKLQFPI